MTAFNNESHRTVMVYNAVSDIKPSARVNNAADNNADPILKMVEESGFEYADKCGNRGCLWIIVGEVEGKQLIDKCKQVGLKFAFSAKGGRASKHRPAWYSLSQ